jgi:hypothetical protein
MPGIVRGVARRLAFCGAVVTSGWKWAKDVLDNVGRALLLLLLVGVGAVSYRFSNPWIITAVGALLVFTVLGEGAYREWHKARTKQSDIDWDAPKTPVLGQTFSNTRVPLDGYSYSQCKFVNVTFVFEGRKPFDLAGNTMVNPLFDFSAAPVARVAVDLLEKLGYIRAPESPEPESME